MSTVIQNIIIPDNNSTSSEWINYYKKLKNKFTTKDARIITARTFMLVGDAGLKNDSAFVEYFKKQGIDFASTGYNILTKLGSIGSDLLSLPQKAITIAMLPMILAVVSVTSIIIVRIIKK